MKKRIMMLVLGVAVIIVAIFGIFTYLNNNQNESQDTNGTVSNESKTDDINIENMGNTLILYFSMSGNTETVANYIHEEIGGDIVKLETVQTYPEDYDELVDYAREEQRDNARPELETAIENIEQYDTIFLGYPNWWGDMPMPIYSFLDRYDLSNKTIAPFITHGGSGLSGTPANIANEEPDAVVTEGLAINGDDVDDCQDEVNEWLNELNF
ncbi:MAG TPA: NAD(P)H-dependent oxidoreductase [Candidatus Erysipelatoclostridium merdavium]|uniref:NAD(P)H-dependent oxidoreductase n=1 Tax=Candidatus Erysipelatoclostridium merdavium TaxID=2838566 RepID=A0A9D1XL31_9FIRM|nr:NAD(P)H-dependent oxidoreductase [Candidatus Erysipelatoclostridium merdavium]